MFEQFRSTLHMPKAPGVIGRLSVVSQSLICLDLIWCLPWAGVK